MPLGPEGAGKARRRTRTSPGAKASTPEPGLGFRGFFSLPLSKDEPGLGVLTLGFGGLEWFWGRLGTLCRVCFGFVIYLFIFLFGGGGGVQDLWCL